MADKKEIKQIIYNRIDKIMDDVEKIKKLDFFEINIKCVNGDIVSRLGSTYKDKAK
jgi:hypothetical protein